MEKNPEIQFRSPEEIKRYQEAQLAKALAYLHAHSKF
jgi:phenylacetate-CoA ligase